ncbi:MAG: class I SAM-dependent methyltransferase [Gammaproteobacteria bacterium]
MTTDPFAGFKAAQREGWALFAPLEALTTPPAAALVEFAGVQAGQQVLDVACGTGVVAVTAARRGAHVRALDLAPALLERARQNAALAEVSVDFVEGDVEALPYADASFDVVMSQFGHMFGPRPEVTLAELLRVLKPGGRIAFSTWPPEMFTGRMFLLVNSYLSPPPGVPPVTDWGNPHIVRERLGDAVTDITFERELMIAPALSPAHYRATFERTAAPVIKLVEALKDDAPRLAKFRGELDALIALYLKGNVLRQHFLMTRATRR